jgi:hypothetical protein
MSSTPPDDILVAHYALLFVDLVAQKELLDKTARLPQNKDEEKAFNEALKYTSGQVEVFRDFFDKFFDAACDEPGTLTPSSEEERKFMEICTKAEIRKQCFSDTMIYYCCLLAQPDRLSITSVRNLLGGAAAGFFLTLSLKLPCRAAIEVGTAREFAPGDLYGHVVKLVYSLESQVAQFPRIVIGNQLLQFLAGESNNPDANPLGELRRALASEATKWIIKDIDGIPVLDYAGHWVKEAFPDMPADTMDKALAFVESEWKRFIQDASSKPLHQTLAARYSLLHRYLLSRKDIWK